VAVQDFMVGGVGVGFGVRLPGVVRWVGGVVGWGGVFGAVYLYTSFLGGAFQSTVLCPLLIPLYASIVITPFDTFSFRKASDPP